MRRENGSLSQDTPGENDYTLIGDSFWVTIGKVQLYVYKSRDSDGTEAVTVEAMPRENEDSAMDPPLAHFSLLTGVKS